MKSRAAYMREYRRLNASRLLPLRKAYREQHGDERQMYVVANRAKIAGIQKRYNHRLRDEVYAAYGGYTCVCCGETHKTFLTLDHVNNDGAAHRKAIGNCGNLYTWLKRNGFPPGLLQVLCANCNTSKQRNGGTCEHQAGQVALH